MKDKKILLVDDDVNVVKVLSKALKQEGYCLTELTQDFDTIVKEIMSTHPDVILLDVNLLSISGIDVLKEIKQNDIDIPVIMLTGDVTADTAVTAMKLGAADYVTKPCDIDELNMVIKKSIEKESLKHEVDYLRRLSDEYLNKNLIGESQAIKELQSQIAKIASAHCPNILITGESGTGKEVFSRYIHRVMNYNLQSESRPFVAINCAAIPEHLMESEMFGHEKGAFTDAKAVKKGVFELAHGGSLLLDEIGEMDIALQTKLLRVLEEGKIRRTGGKWEIPVDVTVIACSNRNLSDAVKSGDFRSDLFFRLSQFYIHIPPLRERREDIPLLSRHFLLDFCNRYNKKMIKGFSREAEKIMSSYSWPGNVRELKSLIEKIVVYVTSEEILPEHLPDYVLKNSTNAKASYNKFILPEQGINLNDVKKDLYLQALKKAGNNKAVAAKLLNVSYDSLRYFIKKYGLK